MGLAFTTLIGTFLALAVLTAAPAASHAQGQQPPVRPAPATQDFRAAFRAQIEDELAQLRPRLAKAESDAKTQAERYKEMAASKAEMARKTAEKAQTERARADAAAARKGYAAKIPGKSADAAKKPGAKDAKAAAGGEKGKGGEGAAGGAAASSGEAGTAPKKIDPVLTQQYLVMSLRDQVRLLRDRIAYLEGLLARM
jgi:hypothetical protein